MGLEVGGCWGRGGCCREWVWAEVARLPGFSVCRKCRFGCEEWNVPSCPPRAETAVEELELERKIAKWKKKKINMKIKPTLENPTKLSVIKW